MSQRTGGGYVAFGEGRARHFLPVKMARSERVELAHHHGQRQVRSGNTARDAVNLLLTIILHLNATLLSLCLRVMEHP